jgi:hypothetical protein
MLLLGVFETTAENAERLHRSIGTLHAKCCVVYVFEKKKSLIDPCSAKQTIVGV